MTTVVVAVIGLLTVVAGSAGFWKILESRDRPEPPSTLQEAVGDTDERLAQQREAIDSLKVLVAELRTDLNVERQERREEQAKFVDEFGWIAQKLAEAERRAAVAEARAAAAERRAAEHEEAAMALRTEVARLRTMLEELKRGPA